MNIPRPESRLSELESKMAIQDARIRELSDDTDENFRALRQDIQRGFADLKQDIKQLSMDKTSFEEMDDVLRAVATKEDLTALETRVQERFEKLEQEVQGIRQEHGQMLKEILARLPKSE